MFKNKKKLEGKRYLETLDKVNKQISEELN
jgi:hypothetical protein